MWYDNTSRGEYKETKINLWRIRWGKKEKRWLVGYMKEQQNKTFLFETVFTCDTKDEGIDYAVQHVCPQQAVAKPGSGANSGALAGIRGRNGNIHRRLADRNSYYRQTAAIESKKAKIAKKLRREQWQSE